MQTTRTNPATLAATVDRLAAINASIDALNDEAKALKAALIDSGQKTINGHLHRAQVFAAHERECVNWREVAERLNPSRQLIKAYTRIVEAPARVSLYDLN